MKAGLGARIDEAAKNDPAVLHRRIAELEKAKTVSAPDPAALEKARANGYNEGLREGLSIRDDAFNEILATIHKNQKDHKAGKKQPMIELKINSTPGGKFVPQEHKYTPFDTKSVNEIPMSHVMPRSDIDSVKLNVAETKFLIALAQRRGPLSRDKIAKFAGYSVKSRHVDNTLAALRQRGFVVGSGASIEITVDGMSALGSFEPLPTGQALRDHWLGQLNTPQRAFLAHLFSIYPRQIHRDDLARATNYSPTSRHVDNTLADLRGYDLITGGKDAIKASDDLY